MKRTIAAAWLAVSLAPLVAHATPATCVEANERALEERKKLALRDAQRDFAVCTDPSCPSDIATECARQLHEVSVEIPSVVFAAKSDAGEDLTDVRVEMDGQVLAEHLGATALVVDPGEHTFVLTAKGRGSVTRKLLVREGEKDRAESVTFTTPPPLPPRSPAVTRHDGAWRVTGAALAGVGLAGVVLGAIFGVVAISAYDEQKKQCPAAPCTGTARDDASQAHERAAWSSTASSVGFIAGGVLVVAGGVVFFAAPVVRADRVALSIGGTF